MNFREKEVRSCRFQSLEQTEENLRFKDLCGGAFVKPLVVGRVVRARRALNFHKTNVPERPPPAVLNLFEQLGMQEIVAVAEDQPWGFCRGESGVAALETPPLGLWITEKRASREDHCRRGRRSRPGCRRPPECTRNRGRSGRRCFQTARQPGFDLIDGNDNAHPWAWGHLHDSFFSQAAVAGPIDIGVEGGLRFWIWNHHFIPPAQRRRRKVKQIVNPLLAVPPRDFLKLGVCLTRDLLLWLRQLAKPIGDALQGDAHDQGDVWGRVVGKRGQTPIWCRHRAATGAGSNR